MSTLYMTDLDGTLMNSNAVISVHSREILNLLLDHGLLFTAATARSSASGMEKLAGLHFRLPVALMNGVLMFCPTTLTYVHHISVPDDCAARIMDSMNRFGQTAYVFTFANNQLYANYLSLSTAFQRQFCAERCASGLKKFVQVASFQSLLGQNACIFFSMTGAYDMLFPIRQDIERHTSGLNVLMYEDFHDHIWYLEIFSKDASKAHSLLWLKAYCHADETVCFGDNYNDLAMMLAANRSYAVKNAVADVLHCATAVIGNHNDDAVANFILHDCGLFAEK